MPKAFTEKRSIRIILLVVVFLFGTVSSYTNDRSFTGKGGTIAPLTGKEHPYVSMKREWVRMDLYDDYCEVTAQFDFFNEGPNEMVRMGFPERNSYGSKSDELRKKSGFVFFRSWVDGYQAKVKRVYMKNKEAEYATGAIFAYWIKTVRMKSNTRHIVRVKYRALYGKSVMSEKLANYDFTGKNWKGNIENSFLMIVSHMKGAHLFLEEYGDLYEPNPKNNFLLQKENRLSLEKTNWDGDMEFTLYIDPTIDTKNQPFINQWKQF